MSTVTAIKKPRNWLIKHQFKPHELITYTCQTDYKRFRLLRFNISQFLAKHTTQKTTLTPEKGVFSLLFFWSCTVSTFTLFALMQPLHLWVLKIETCRSLNKFAQVFTPQTSETNLKLWGRIQQGGGRGGAQSSCNKFVLVQVCLSTHPKSESGLGCVVCLIRNLRTFVGSTVLWRSSQILFRFSKISLFYDVDVLQKFRMIGCWWRQWRHNGFNWTQGSIFRPAGFYF